MASPSEKAPGPSEAPASLHKEVARERGRPPRLAWHSGSAAAIIAHCQGDGQRGLSSAEARGRRERIGDNRLAEQRRVSMWRRLLAQITDITVLALLLAAGIAFLLALLQPVAGQGPLQRFGDSAAILMIVVLNAVLGFVQERRAESALDALREMTAPTARVVRGGEVAVVPALELVPGDLVLLEDGDRVPADLRLLTTLDLMVNEATLTGESMPVHKNAALELASETPLSERATMAFMGTQVQSGRGRGIVTNTGMHTELGGIAGMLAEVETEATPLEREMDRFGKQLVLLCVGVSAVVFGAGALSGQQGLRELFLTAVALAVAAIPEGLPAVTTIVLAIGTQRMAQRHALVRRLPAVETLGCAQVICTDKTGTLTQNMMSARSLYVMIAPPKAGGGPSGVRCEVDQRGGLSVTEGARGDETLPSRTLRHLLWAAAHATGAHLTQEAGGPKIVGDPTDGALLLLGEQALGGQRAEHRHVHTEQPFTSRRRMASVVVDGPDGCGPVVYVRGAPEAVLERCTRVLVDGEGAPLFESLRGQVLEEAALWAGQAMRVIALACRQVSAAAEGPSSLDKDEERDLALIALVGIIDPPRPEVRQAVAEARTAGIKTIMITGDHPATAKAIALSIDLWQEGDELLSGEELDYLDQQQLIGRIDRVRVVARATAEHKLRIVEALKARGLVCAMTGDGVNDAPAVKAASIGIAMGRTGTDVTKEAASLVLSDDNYATIVAAVEEGRAIYANIRKFIFFLLSSNTGCVLVVFVASLLSWKAPLLPVQILWINLITNGLPALALGLDGREAEQMREPPRPPGGQLISRREYLQILLIGAVMAATALLAYHVALGDPHKVHSEEVLSRARTLCFAILAVGPLLHSFNCRSRTRSIFADGVRGLCSNRPLLWALLIGVALEGATLYLPFLRPVFKTVALGGTGLLWVLAMSLVPVAVVEMVKKLVRIRAG